MDKRKDLKVILKLRCSHVILLQDVLFPNLT